ncbi:hypothetical protein B0H63DRAFT_507657 [Podospora didyma]|uniref:Uncharacterized protein n=1 Tax=Podospora didyma TaxID=330526 RepID=A0AAE0U498_9PEZI|nr:hypothetical protein B0H63DRAFT_507657 [Podospora didyma]
MAAPPPQSTQPEEVEVEIPEHLRPRPAVLGVPLPGHLAEHEDDDDAHQKGYIKATDFSIPYYSQWSRLHEAQLPFLRSLNCNYLSTHGKPPTLLALKQHAQGLCKLISELNPTLNSHEILVGDPTQNDAGAAPVADAQQAQRARGDAFDFLLDLTVPYNNDDPNHHKRLFGLLNEVRERDDVFGTRYICPLDDSAVRQEGDKPKPYANHQALIMHTNECLERLDHEFSSTGGLLSILPTKKPHDSENLANARNSLLGQWLLYTQHLVARTHELERGYGNALDVLKGEAAIPRQMDTASEGPEFVTYPQDRWVLANAGDDIFEYIHSLLDRHEAVLQVKEQAWQKNGVAANEQEKTAGKAGDGIVAVSLTSRFYRLAKQGRNTIFVIPGWDHHPAVEHTKRIEDQPTILTSVQPKFPQRASDFERRYDTRLAAAQNLERENLDLRAQVQASTAQLESLREYIRQQDKMRQSLHGAVGKDRGALAIEVGEQRARADQATETQGVQYWRAKFAI